MGISVCYIWLYSLFYMQKPPRFGEKLREFDEAREESALAIYKEFISKKTRKCSLGNCEDLGNFTVFNLSNDTQGLHTKYGLKTQTRHFLSTEEAYFLACRRLIKQSPCEILKHSETFIHKILIYSFFKRKGISIPAKETSLNESLEQKLQISSEKLKPQKTLQIKNPDDLFESVPGEYYINCEGTYEKFKVDQWDFK